MTTREILDGIARLSAVVIGDVCLDRWCHYDPAEAEPSRETGIPRVGVVSVEVTPGAAGTVANNLAALGAGRVSVLGVLGEDGFGFELGRALAARGIQSDDCVRSQDVQTFTYTKIINAATGIEDRPRIDFINTRPLPAAAERLLLDRIPAVIDAHDVIVVSDQAETHLGGVVTPAVRQVICELAPAYPEKIFWIDSRTRIHEFRGVILKPNEQEAAAACAAIGGDFAALRDRAEAPLLLVTHGGAGVTLVDAHGQRRIDTKKVDNPVDICGAGDSFSAGAALALRLTRSPEAAVAFGHKVASITIMKKGTGTASPEEVLCVG